MRTLSEMKEALESRGLAPRKSLGQNFLVDKNLVDLLVRDAGVGEGDLVLEIGPGAGALTEALLERGCEVVACEIDRGLCDLLRETLAPRFEGRLTLVEGDALPKGRLNDDLVRALGGRPWRLIANLPYNVASPILLTILLDHPRCASLHATIQREVAQRLVAPPGSRDYGLPSVLAQALASVRTVAKAPPECFWPRPKVVSSMVAMERREPPLTVDPHGLERLCKALFSKRRKQLGSILGRDVDWPSGVDPTARPESLSPEGVEALRVALEGRCGA